MQTLDEAERMLNSGEALAPAVWWRQPWFVYPLALFAVVRGITLLLTVFSVSLGPPLNPYADDPIFRLSLAGTGPHTAFYGLIEPWHRWDTGWLLAVASHGYADNGTIVFAPLYPLLIRVVSVFTGDTLLSALLSSSAACLAFLCCFYRLALRELKEPHLATMAGLTFIAFPTAFYLLAGYTESLFLAFVSATFLAAFNGRWWLAAGLAFLATLTRTQGWVLFFPVAWLALTQARGLWPLPVRSGWGDYLRRALPRAVAAGAGPAGMIIVYGYFWFSGYGLVSDAYERHWALLIQPPWVPITDVISRILNGTAQWVEVGSLLALVFIVALMLLSARPLHVAYQLYLWPTLVLILLRYYTPMLLNGTMRYVLDFFPIFFTLALVLGARPRLRVVWIVLSFFMQCLMLVIFMRWMWVS